MATDGGPSPDPAVSTSAIEAASERLEAYLKNRQQSQTGAEARPENFSSRDEGLPSTGNDEGVAQQANETAPDGRGLGTGAPRSAPAWIKIALAATVVVAAAEGAYIVWSTRSADVPAAPRSQSAPPTDRSTEARRTAPSGGDSAAKVGPPLAESAPPAVPTRGTIEVRTTPPGATVVFQGRRRGVTPLTIPDVAPGIHDIEVGGWFGSRIQRATVRAGRTAVLDLTVPPRRSSPKGL
ncbi:MAG: PEGA domain-containing protein [Luteitalea sp.]|nr:PEGA domain-containing protein [Luteitalea sp.]